MFYSCIAWIDFRRQNLKSVHALKGLVKIRNILRHAKEDVSLTSWKYKSRDGYNVLHLAHLVFLIWIQYLAVTLPSGFVTVGWEPLVGGAVTRPAEWLPPPGGGTGARGSFFTVLPWGALTTLTHIAIWGAHRGLTLRPRRTGVVVRADGCTVFSSVTWGKIVKKICINKLDFVRKDDIKKK